MIGLTLAESIVLSILLFLLHFTLPFIHGYILKRRRSDKYEERKDCTAAPIFSVEIAVDENITQEDDKNIFKDDVSYGRLISLHSFFWMFVWIICLVFSAYNEGDDPDHAATVLLSFSCCGLGIGLLWMFFESCCSWEVEYLENLSPNQTCVEYLNKLRQVEPAIFITVECYHYETHYRTVTTYNADGTSSTRTESCQEKVVDLVESDSFKFNDWRDVSASPETNNLDPEKVTRVRILKIIRFGDQLTADCFRQQQEAFYEHVKGKGDWKYMDVTFTEVVEGYVPRMASYWKTGDKSCWMSLTCYWLFSGLCFSWIYRLFFNKLTQKASYKLQKVIYAH